MFVVRYKKIFFTISALLIVASVAAFIFVGFNFGLDFTGGSILEVSYVGNRPTLEDARVELDKLSLGGYSLRPSGDKNLVLRTREIDQIKKNDVISALSMSGNLEVREERFNSVGPIVGENLKKKSYWAIGVVIACIVLFITFAFRKVSKPVSSWKYGLATIIALAHDVVVPTGAFLVYGYYTGAEIDVLFITALLAVLGYSVHDTIVVFDRVRENLRFKEEYGINESFEETVGRSVSQTFARSINTSVTLILVTVALYLVGSEATRHFSFILLAGAIIGTYSSIFLASPLLVVFEKIQGKKAK